MLAQDGRKDDPLERRLDEALLDGPEHAQLPEIAGYTNQSVLAVLGETINVPRVSLRDADDGPDPIEHPDSREIPHRESGMRYQLHGEIARGGIGAIIKARDTDLGRDLAIKVLLDEHGHKPEVVQRFIEEAQIGGQLQHPGIAPVYELGQFAGHRPFFSMKLVKGNTLSAMLAQRSGPSVERARFIGIFEQVCQTMAYSHSRGVIHRDLKPSNVMVGAFGEVQVMDWGLAKVLRSGGVYDERKTSERSSENSIVETIRSLGSETPGSIGSSGSNTEMGSVLGTPAYMPPEQALGKIEVLDERADVFGLGAILCEVLTGHPPYVAEDGLPVFRQASRGKLEHCMARLEKCGADERMVGLTKHCLELDPNDRPVDAGEVASQVTAYIESVETKLRETEVQRAAEAARVVEQRKRLRVTLTLATVVLLALVSGVAASAWQARQAERARKAEAARAEGELAARMEAQRQESSAKRALAQSLFNEANSLRLARVAGYRDPAIELIRRSREASSDEITVRQARDAVVACMGDFVALNLKITDVPEGWRLLALHPESRRIVAKDEKRQLVVCDPDGTSTDLVDAWSEPVPDILVPGFPVHEKSKTAIRFSKSGDDLAIHKEDGSSLVYRRSNDWRPSKLSSPEGAKLLDRLLDMAFEPNGRQVYLCGLKQGKLLVIERAESEPERILHEVPITNDPRNAIRASFAGEMDRLVIRDQNDVTQVLDMRTGNLIAHIDGATQSRQCGIAVDEDASVIAYGHGHGLEIIHRDHSTMFPRSMSVGVAVSPNGEWIAYLEHKTRRLCLWSSSRLQAPAILSLPFPATGAPSLKFSSQSLFLRNSRTICEWPLVTSERIRFPGHQRGIPFLDFDASGKLLASACGDGVVRIWDLNSGTLNSELSGYSYPQCIGFGPRNQLLIGDQNGGVELRDLITDERTIVRQRVGMTVADAHDAIYSVAMSTDGNTVAAPTLTRVLLYRRENWESKFIEENRFVGKGFVRISPDDRFLFWLLRKEAKDLGFQIEGFDLVGEAPWRQEPGPRVKTHLNSYMVNTKGELTFVNNDDYLEVWDLSSGELISSQPVHGEAGAEYGTRSPSVRSGDYRYMASTIDGSWLATTDRGVHVIVWRRSGANYEQVFTLPAEPEVIWSLAWSRDGEKLGVGTSGGSLSVWNVAEILKQLDEMEWLD